MGQICSIISIAPAGVMELVDVVDSKSTAGDSVPVRVRSPAPRRCGRHIVRSDFFIKSLLTYSVAAPFKITTASLGCDLVLGADWKAGASKVFVLSSSEIPCLARISALRRGFLAGQGISSLPNRIRSAGFRFGLGTDCDSTHRKRSRHPAQKTNGTDTGVCSVGSSVTAASARPSLC